MRTKFQSTSIIASIIIGTSCLVAGQGDVIVLNSLPSGSDSIVVGRTYLVPLPMEVGTTGAQSSFVLQLHDVKTGLRTIVSDEIVGNSFLRWVVNPTQNGMKRLIVVDLTKGNVVGVSSSYFEVNQNTKESRGLEQTPTSGKPFNRLLHVSSQEQLLAVISEQSISLGMVAKLDAYSYDGRCLGHMNVDGLLPAEQISAFLCSLKWEKYFLVQATGTANTLHIAVTL